LLGLAGFFIFIHKYTDFYGNYKPSSGSPKQETAAFFTPGIHSFRACFHPGARRLKQPQLFAGKKVKKEIFGAIQA
jgi:hypothetical protein